MTKSIFDPTGDQTERSGSRYTSPDAEQISHMPSDVVDGRVATDEQEEAQDAEVEPGLGAAAEQQRQVDLEAPGSRRFQTQGETKEEVAEPPHLDQTE